MTAMKTCHRCIFGIVIALMQTALAQTAGDTRGNADSTVQRDIAATAAAAKGRPILVINYQVLKSSMIDLGDHKLILNRVVPPLLQAAPVKIQQGNPQVSDAALAKILAAQKKSEVLFFSATVYDHKMTEIRWMDGEHQCTAFSNVDFNLFGGSARFATADTVVSLLLVVGNQNSEANELARLSASEAGKPLPVGKLIPSLDQFSPTRAQYLVVEDEAGAAPQAKDLAVLDALHVYFDANRQRLATEYASREAARIAHEQRPKAPPSKPKDTVVNFWPGNGTVIIDAMRR